MSTRCNVAIKLSADSTIFLYRHSDGYLSECGKTLAREMAKIDADCEKLPGKRYSADADLVTALLALKYDDDRAIYELTHDVHCDINYFYQIQRGEAGWMIQWAEGYGDAIASQLGGVQSLAGFKGDVATAQEG
jgi:hypothetical protein